MMDKQSIYELNNIKTNLQHDLPMNEYIYNLRQLVQIKPIQKQIIKFFLNNNIYQDYQIPYIVQHQYNNEHLTKEYEEKVQQLPFDFFRMVGKDIHPFGRLEAMYLIDVLQSSIYKQQARVQNQKFTQVKAHPQPIMSRAIEDSNSVDTEIPAMQHQNIFYRFFKGLKRFFKDFFWEN